MGAKYSTQAASGYNSSPPPDDGSQSASNQITWAAQKTKLADPVKNLADNINTALVATFDYSVRQISSSDSTVASDHMRTVEIAPTATIAVTVSLGDAATMTNVYRVFVKNSSSLNQTVGRLTVGDTIDGTAANIKIAPGQGILFGVINAATGYVILSKTTPYCHGSDVASATTLNLDTATGDIVDVTGTTTITAITLADGKQATVRFTGSLGITNGASLVLPGGVSLTTVAGDFAIFRGYASGVVRCVHYQRVNVQPDPALILLATGSASSSAAVDVSGAFSSIYDEYVFEISDLTPATDNTELWLRASEDAGSTFKAGASDYGFSRTVSADTNVPNTAGSTGDTKIVIAANLSNTKSFRGTVKLTAPSGTARHKQFEFHSSYEPSGLTIATTNGAGTFKLDTNAINAVRFMMSSGNITNGNFVVYGVRKTI